MQKQNTEKVIVFSIFHINRVNPEVNYSNETLGRVGVHCLNHKGSLKKGVSQASQELLREVHSWERAVSRLKENIFLFCVLSVVLVK